MIFFIILKFVCT